MLTLTLLAALNASPWLASHESLQRVHVVVEADTRDLELVRVRAVRAGYVGGYLAVAVDADRVCRGTCNTDVDVDPRYDYVLRIGDEDPRPVDLTEQGQSVVFKVTPPRTGLRSGGTALLASGIAVTAVGGVTGIFGLMETWLGSYSASTSYRPGAFGIDPGVKIALGLGAVAVGVTALIIGIVMKRHAGMEIDTVPGSDAPSAPRLRDDAPLTI